jgi:PAS domain S-box-containing protein
VSASPAGVIHLQRDLAIALAAAETEQVALDALLDAAVQLEGVDGCGAYLRPPCRGPLLLAAHRGISERFAAAVTEWSLDGPGMTEQSRGGVIHLQHAGEPGQLGEWLEPSRTEGLRSSFAVPIHAEGELLAVGVFACRGPQPVGEPVRESIETLVRQVGLVLRRVRAEARRRELEQLLGYALRTARIGTWRWRCAADEVLWSDEMYEIYGRERGVYQPTIGFLRELAHPEDREPDLQLLARGEGAHASNAFEQRVLRPDGSFRHVVCQLEARSDGGALREVVGIVHDVTDQRRTEDALATRLRYETALASASNALLIGGPGVFERVCENLLAATTVSRVYIHRRYDDPELGPCTRLITEICAPGIRANLGTPELQLFPIQRGGFERTHRLLTDGEAVQGVVEFFPPSEREVLERFGVRSVLLLPILVEGRYWGLVGFDDCEQERIWRAEDVLLLRTVAAMIGTHLSGQRATAEVRRLERQRAVETFRLITDHVRDVVWMAGLDLRFSYVSPSLLELFGFTPEQALRQSLERTLGAEGLASLRGVLAEELERDRVLADLAPYRVRSLRLEAPHHDGHPVPVEVFVTFLRDGEGRPDGVLGVARRRE